MANKVGSGEKSTLARILGSWQLYVLLIPAILWLAVFAYYPMYGVIIAFKDFKARSGILGSPWADPIFKYFEQFFTTSIAVTAIKNTILLSLEQLVISFPIPVIFALLLNQVRSNKARKAVQTISYAPYFLSNVILVCIMQMLFSATASSTTRSSLWAETSSPSSPVKNISVLCTSVPPYGSRWALTPSFTSQL